MGSENPFTNYCNAVCARVRWPFARWRITQELTAHLEDHAAVLKARGLSPQEARVQAVAAMGDPDEVGRALNRVHSPRWGLAFTALRLLSLCLLLLLLESNFPGGLPQALVSRFYTPIRTIEQELDLGAQLISRIPLDQWRQVDTLHVHYTNAYLVRHASSNARSPYWLYLEGNLWQGDPFHQVSTLSYVSSHEPPSPVSFSDNLGHTYDFSGAWYVGHLDPRASEIYLDYDQFGRHYRLTIPLDWGADS